MAEPLLVGDVEPNILVDCCGSPAGLQAHLAGLPQLHETYLAAPKGDPTPATLRGSTPGDG